MLKNSKNHFAVTYLIAGNPLEFHKLQREDEICLSVMV